MAEVSLPPPSIAPIRKLQFSRICNKKNKRCVSGTSWRGRGEESSGVDAERAERAASHEGPWTCPVGRFVIYHGIVPYQPNGNGQSAKKTEKCGYTPDKSD